MFRRKLQLRELLETNELKILQNCFTIDSNSHNHDCISHRSLPNSKEKLPLLFLFQNGKKKGISVINYSKHYILLFAYRCNKTFQTNKK